MTTDRIQKARRDVLLGCRTICSKGYVLGTAGNISARVDGTNLFAITPTSFPYASLTEDDLVVADMQGNIIHGNHKPSIEFSLHRAIYAARKDVQAIVHTHSKYATAASATQGVTTVPIIDIETAMYVGGHIAVAPFAMPGSEELARNAVTALGDRAGVILEGHGAIAAGKTMEAAMVASDTVERACEIYLIARTAGGVKHLPKDAVKALCELSRKHRGMGFSA